MLPIKGSATDAAASAQYTQQLASRSRLNPDAPEFRSRIAAVSNASAVQRSDMPGLPATVPAGGVLPNTSSSECWRTTAAMRLGNLESCSAIAEDLGIVRPEERFELEVMAVSGAAGLCVANGGSCLGVAEKFGISMRESQLELQSVAVQGVAGSYVKYGGESCEEVAAWHGIIFPEARYELEMLLVDGFAGMRVRNGEHWHRVAYEHGIGHYAARLALRAQANPGMWGAGLDGQLE